MKARRSRRWISGLLVLMLLVSHLNMMASGGEIVISKSQIVVTIGADLSEDQKAFMMQYFGLAADQVQIITVTNEDEHKALDALLSEDRVGNQTYSCAVVRPTSAGGIQVKTVNMTYVTSNMIASTLVTSGVYNCEVITAAPFKVSGTGALTGVMMAYENASGEAIEPEKKELANEEIIITDEVSDDVGKNRAILIVNDIKITIARDGVTDPDAVYAVVDNVIATTQQAAYEKAMKKGKDAPKEITTEATQRLYDFGKKFSQGDYKYKEMQRTLERVTYNVVQKTGYDDPIMDTFTTLDDEISLDPDSILLATDDDLLGDKAVVNATSSVALGKHEAEKIPLFKGEVTLTNGGSVRADGFIRGTSIVSYKDLNGSYALMDLNGNVLTDALYTNDFSGEYGHINAILNDGSGARGLLETDGTISIPFKYPAVEVFGTNWAAGMNLSATGTEENYDYRSYDYVDGETKYTYFLIDTIDMYYIDDGGGKLVGTLSADQMEDRYSVNAYGPHINIKAKNGVITVYDSDFNSLGTSDYLYVGSEDETDKIRDAIAEKTGFIVRNFYGNYAVIKDYNKDSHNTGVVDLYGNYIIPMEFDDIDTNYYSDNGSLVAHGYFGGELDGKFVYIKQGGKVKATYDYPIDDIRNYGMSALYKADDESVTILSGDGKITELGNTYSYVHPLYASRGMFYECTTANYNYDLVDWHGNVLISNTNGLSLASNGNYLISQEGYTSNTLYLVNDASPVALADSAGGATEVEAEIREGASLEPYTGEPQLEEVGEVLGDSFVEGTHLVIASNDGDHYALMSLAGEQLTNPIFTRYFNYRHGWVIAEHEVASGEEKPVSGKEVQNGLVSPQGQIVIPCEYDHIRVLNENWAVAYKFTADATEDDNDFHDYDGHYFYISEATVFHLSETETLSVSFTRDQFGDVAAADQYLNIEDRTSGAVLTYDSEFNPIASVNYVSDFSNFSSTYALEKRLKDQTGYYISDEDFPDGYSRVSDYSSDKSQYGVVDMHGEIVLPVQYDRVETFYQFDSSYCLANGYFGVEKDGLFSFVTSGGEAASDKSYPVDDVNFLGMSALVKAADGTYTLVSADGVETPGSEYGYPSNGGRGLLLEFTHGDHYQTDLVDWHGNVLIEDIADAAFSEDGRYVIVEHEYGAKPVLYSVDGAAQEDGLVLGGTSQVSSQETDAPDDMDEEYEETETASTEAPAVQSAAQTEAPEEDDEPEETEAAAANTAPSMNEGTAPAAEASNSAAAPLLTSAINLATVDIAANKDAIVVLLQQAQTILETENPAAGQLVSSAITLIQAGSEADPVLTLLNSAASLL